jgi:acyl-CoA thioesterase-1
MLAPAAEPANVIVFGDSITAGGALPATEKAQLWVTVVEKESAGRLKMINEGKGGRPTDSVKEFDAMLARQPKAEVLVLALGMNDSRDTSGQCVPKAVAHLRTMMEKARKAYGEGVKILIAGPTNIRKDALGPTKPIADQRAANLHDMGVAFEALAKEQHARFVSLYGVVPETSLGKDGVHPDGAGNAPIANALLPVLLELAGEK